MSFVREKYKGLKQKKLNKIGKEKAFEELFKSSPLSIKASFIDPTARIPSLYNKSEEIILSCKEILIKSDTYEERNSIMENNLISELFHIKIGNLLMKN